MIQKNPADRFSASEYLKTQTGKAFPNYFYTFMLDFMTRFSADPSMGPDTKIER
jgi:phosphoinositide-3-kinase regulatory subunit 4